jgi:hypothetical protein
METPSSDVLGMVKNLNDTLSRMQISLLEASHPRGKPYSLPGVKDLIISTGDISDIDGFYALAKYAQSGADVLFIMNYPAYLDVIMSTKVENSSKLDDNQLNGLGYNFTTQTYIDTFESEMSKSFEPAGGESTLSVPRTQYQAYLMLKSRYDPVSESSLPEMWMKRMFTDLGFTMARDVWNETTAPYGVTKGNLYFHVGGINSISPFSATESKNEIFVYADSLLKDVDFHSLSCTEGNTYDKKQETVSVEDLLNASKSIYMDFNGSMAFYHDKWSSMLSSLKAKIQAVFVMGGVFSTTATQTMPKIKNKLNRFSCATMNQLYSPKETFNFFQDIRKMEIPIFVITNNVVHDLKEPNGLGWLRFITENGIHSDALQTLANKYYTSKYNPPHKAFDFYTALALTKKMNGVNVAGDKILLYFDSKYGLCVIGNNNRVWKEVIGDYYKCLDLEINDKDQEFIKSKKLNLTAEKEVLTVYEKTSSIIVQVLLFDLVDSVLLIK